MLTIIRFRKEKKGQTEENFNVCHFTLEIICEIESY